MGVWTMSLGLAKELTSRGGPPSTLTRAMPILRPRAPSQRMEVPLKVMVAVAPAVEDCMAEPPLHPMVALACIQLPLKATPTFSSMRFGMEGGGASGAGAPPKGRREMVFVCVWPLTVAVKVP